MPSPISTIQCHLDQGSRIEPTGHHGLDGVLVYLPIRASSGGNASSHRYPVPFHALSKCLGMAAETTPWKYLVWRYPGKPQL